MFAEVTEDCLAVLQKHSGKGDSWKTCSTDFLRRKVMEEYFEWLAAVNGKGSERRELIDLVNMCVMLLKRKELNVRDELRDVDELGMFAL